MEKSIFIKKLLENEKFSKDQKERFLQLVVNEYSNNQLESDELLEQLNNIKNSNHHIPSDLNIKLKNLLEEKRLKKIKATDICSVGYVDPMNLYNFLHDYNQNPILKTTCHLIDSDELINILKYTKKNRYSFNAHKKAIEQEYFSLLEKYRGKTFKSTNALIGEYLNGFRNVGWTTDKILLNWSSSELKEWAVNNSGYPPNPAHGLGEPFKFKPINLKSGYTLNNFSDLVLHFKKQIQFKGKQGLLDMIDEVNFQFRKEAIFNVDRVKENLRLYTDTSKVRQIYKALVRMSIEHFKEAKKEEIPIFDLIFEEDRNKIVFSIHNTNSQFGKSINDVESRYGQDFTNLIDKQINGVCDFSLTADFIGEYADISIWPPGNPVFFKSFNGVQFNLIFYRTK